MILFAHFHSSATRNNANKPSPNKDYPNQDLIVPRSIFDIVAVGGWEVTDRENKDFNDNRHHRQNGKNMTDRPRFTITTCGIF